MTFASYLLLHTDCKLRQHEPMHFEILRQLIPQHTSLAHDKCFHWILQLATYQSQNTIIQTYIILFKIECNLKTR